MSWTIVELRHFGSYGLNHGGQEASWERDIQALDYGAQGRLEKDMDTCLHWDRRKWLHKKTRKHNTKKRLYIRKKKRGGGRKKETVKIHSMRRHHAEGPLRSSRHRRDAL